ncbi:MFS transporter [Devosia faecipullorum]|uniref:MFS transporter n=1 Tax=Devosia faecipullorum TaxID=2755039 RepID=UPI00187B48A5|nr:MFS transporter [Devosia faecipullorum]MBE7734563.1 MFS transporter [Devosia faecipullorum]
MNDQTTGRHNIFVLTAAQALGGASAPIVISLGGLVGQQLSSDPALVTLPVSLLNLGLALGTLPSAYVTRRFGRRSGYMFGAGIGALAGLVAALGIFAASFLVFCAGTFLAGFYGAYVQSYRFAAADAASGPDKVRAISWVMVGGLVAAIIGPQLVIWTRDAVSGTPYLGSFLSQAALALMAIPVLMLLRPNPAGASAADTDAPARSLMQILLMPRYMLAVAAGIVSYGLMAFVMTAAPIAMVGHGHSVDHAALGIQWHVLAMFAPSFFTGSLMARFGKERITALGLLLIAISAIVALMGLDLGHFWISLVLLGIGWNFGFIGATAMITDCHSPAERGMAQGANDFMVFGTVAAASFFAGGLLHASGWQAINWLVFPAVALILVPLVWQSGRRR